jgi:ABC-type glycerol-3-phosphate transport system substrate-binding protein
MKKTIFAIAMVMALISCGGSEESTAASDSAFIVDSILAQDTAVVVDTVTVGGGIQDGTEVK